jgi:hypothetical protein
MMARRFRMLGWRLLQMVLVALLAIFIVFGLLASSWQAQKARSEGARWYGNGNEAGTILARQAVKRVLRRARVHRSFRAC